MALTATDRKNISKKYVVIPEENATFQQSADNLDILLTELESQDGSYKNLFDGDNALIDSYHPELDLLDGIIRTSIVEQDILDSANKVKGNFFFPNDFTTSTPSLPDGIWKQLKSHAKNLILGKDYQESFGSQDTETDKITVVTDLTTSIAADYTQTERQTGDASGLPNPPDTVDLQDDLQALKDAVDDWELWLTDQKTALEGNTDTQQASEIAAALSDVNAALSEISDWEALTDFAIGGKLDDSGLQILDDETSARNTFIPSRITEVTTRLGDVVQASDGNITSQSGLYANRYINVDLRLNLAQGTLTRQVGVELSRRVQLENIDNNNVILSYFTDSVLVASKLAIDADSTNVIEVEDGSIFSISDNVYVVSDTQAEVLASITNISSNTITLDTNISTDFKISELARLLKEV